MGPGAMSDSRKAMWAPCGRHVGTMLGAFRRHCDIWAPGGQHSGSRVAPFGANFASSVGCRETALRAGIMCMPTPFRTRFTSTPGGGGVKDESGRRLRKELSQGSLFGANPRSLGLIVVPILEPVGRERRFFWQGFFE